MPHVPRRATREKASKKRMAPMTGRAARAPESATAKSATASTERLVRTLGTQAEGHSFKDARKLSSDSSESDPMLDGRKTPFATSTQVEPFQYCLTIARSTPKRE